MVFTTVRAVLFVRCVDGALLLAICAYVPEKKVDVNDPEFWTKCVGLTVPVEKEEQLGR